MLLRIASKEIFYAQCKYSAVYCCYYLCFKINRITHFLYFIKAKISEEILNF